MNFSRMTVIIPTLNEAGNIWGILFELTLRFPNVNILVCDDDSEDMTLEIVKEFMKDNKRVNFIHRRNKDKGLTASIIDGINKVETEYYLVMDADLQHPPEKVGEFFSRLEEGCDIVLGNRTKIALGWPLHRLLASLVASFLSKARLLHKGFAGYDLLTGFSAGRTNIIRSIIAINRRGFSPACFQFAFNILKFAPSNIKVGTVGYTFYPRKAGSSKLGMRQVVEFLKLVCC